MGTKLKILNADGREWDAQLDPGITIQSLKEMTFEHFYPDPPDISPFEFRFINPTELRIIGEYHDIKGENLKDGDMLLFVQHRPVVSHEVVTESALNAPTMADIIEATKNLPAMDTKSKTGITATSGPDASTLKQGSAKDLITLLHRESSESTVDFQVMLRKMLISLTSVMAVILEGNQEAEQICRQFQRRLKTRLQHMLASQTDSNGTPPNLLKLSDDSAKLTPTDIVDSIVALKKCEFKPDPKAMDSLKEMGFNEQEIFDALRANKNRAEKAADWLVNGHHAPANDGDIGLDANSQLFKTLVTNSTIRLGLSNPKMLLAFLSIIDSANAAQDWLRDPDSSAVIQTIFQVYHTEKHAGTEESD